VKKNRNGDAAKRNKTKMKLKKKKKREDVNRAERKRIEHRRGKREPSFGKKTIEKRLLLPKEVPGTNEREKRPKERGTRRKRQGAKGNWGKPREKMEKKTKPRPSTKKNRPSGSFPEKARPPKRERKKNYRRKGREGRAYKGRNKTKTPYNRTGERGGLDPQMQEVKPKTEHKHTSAKKGKATKKRSYVRPIRRRELAEKAEIRQDEKDKKMRRKGEERIVKRKGRKRKKNC